ncbi:glycosyltransferase [Corynebacterium breve]|uniref:Glycosyltransferase n=1 Tax=Corynebacterium breve TaxID=3049799 RepID=A0ABY8VEX5_9CORY|nr:glycosyltransferase [Corynebacterium breve]WIM68039.1 glycosyltransferase [Corynebacterium breve]
MWIDYVLRQVGSSLSTGFKVADLLLTSRSSSRMIPHSGDTVISLTTHGPRLRTVYLTIESLIQGTQRAPIILWLDRDDYEGVWPKTLRNLVERGLQVRCSDGLYGPHTKYWGTFRELAGSGIRVVTVDDDMIYPTWFLEKLLIAAEASPDCVVAYRTHAMKLDDEGLLPYKYWKPTMDTEPSRLNFFTGVSGVAYPPSMVSFVVEQGDVFLQCTPRADDVWLNACALRSGHLARQVYNHPRDFAVIPSTQLSALVVGNTLMGGNDEQIALTYRPRDISSLIDAHTLELDRA